MIAVLCVLAIVTVVCLSLLLAGFQMFKTTTDQTADMQYYQQAESLSKVMKTQLTTKDSSLNKYVIKNIDNPTLTYTAPAPSASYGKVSLTINVADANTDESTGEEESKDKYVTLIVEILNRDGKAQASVSDRYKYTATGSTFAWEGRI